MEKIDILNLSKKELEEQFVKLGLKTFNVQQIFEWIYKKNILDFSKFNNISKISREILSNTYFIGSLKIIKVLIDGKDETTKFLFELKDGERIETVLMKFNYGYSVCVSTEVGCNMGCKFCASGLLKKKRDLQSGEILLQILEVNKYLLEKKKSKISNIVVMGIGEPFDNYQNLKKALEILIDHKSMSIGARHITVSTCGLANKIVQFGKDFPQVNLAISLHASNDKIRDSIMPVNKAFNIATLFSELKKYAKFVNRKITFEYLLLKDINDSDENAHELVKLLKDFTCLLNIIKYNGISEHSFKRSERSQSFCKILLDSNINVTTRLERGLNIDAACGQLRSKYEQK